MAMQVKLVWDDDQETVIRWRFMGVASRTDYLTPMTKTIRMAIHARTNAAAILPVGWRLPFPDRKSHHLFAMIRDAPPSLALILVATSNPLVRRLIARHLPCYPELADRLIVVPSLSAARQVIAARRAGADRDPAWPEISSPPVYEPPPLPERPTNCR